MANLFTSDLHFFHTNIIKYCNRPFDDVKSMNEAMIRDWNRKVKPEDTVYNLGDVIFGGSDKMKAVLPRLNGEKILILGNHDEESALKPYFSNIYRMFEVTDEQYKQRFMLCHYPIESWPGQHHSTVHLHGHCHGTLEHVIHNRMDVGIDCHPRFEVFTVPEILFALKANNPSKPTGGK